MIQPLKPSRYTVTAIAPAAALTSLEVRTSSEPIVEDERSFVFAYRSSGSPAGVPDVVEGCVRPLLIRLEPVSRHTWRIPCVAELQAGGPARVAWTPAAPIKPNLVPDVSPEAGTLFVVGGGAVP